MKIHSMAIVVALMSATAAMAQDKAEPAKGGLDHDCILASDSQTWTSLGLTADQIRRVEDIKASCRKECEAMKTKEGDTKKEMDKGAMDRHDAQLKSVLSADQYNKWVAWCKGRSMKTHDK